jgi:hypothetical protein
MRSLLADLGIPDAGNDVAAMQLKLNDVLLRETSSGKKVVIVIDEAQALSEEVLEVLRMLSNFETSREKLVHIVLAGQPQLADRLASSSMIQFRQRISIVARLNPFDAAETRAYIEHRLRVAGHKGWRAIFTDHAYALIAKHSQGIPRNINNLCFNAMSLGCALGQRSIGPSVIYEVLSDLDLRPRAIEPTDGPTDHLASSTPIQSPWHFLDSFRRRLVAFTLFALVAAILCWPLPLTRIDSNRTAAVADPRTPTSKVANVPSQSDSQELNSSAQVQQPQKTKTKPRQNPKRNPQ